MSLIEEVNRFIIEKEKEMETLKKEIEAAYTFKESIEKQHKTSQKGTFLTESEVTENQELIEALKRKRRKKITQVKAIAYVAKRIMDSNRRFKVTEVKNIMVAAGYFSKNPGRAYNSVSTPIRRSNKFRYIEAGIYELIDKSISNELG